MIAESTAKRAAHRPRTVNGDHHITARVCDSAWEKLLAYRQPGKTVSDAVRALIEAAPTPP